MKGEIIIIPAEISEPIRREPRNKQPPLDELHKIVGGYIELVPYWDHHEEQPCVVYCNEDGKGDGLPINDRATMMWWRALGQRVDDVLVGNVCMVINLPDDDEEDWP